MSTWPSITLATCIFCVGITGCAEDTDGLNASMTAGVPLEQFAVVDADAVAKAQELRQPGLVVLNSRNAGTAQPELLFYNPLPQTVSLHGYVETTSHVIGPFYEAEIRDQESDEWQVAELGWCGTGAGILQIPPGHAGRFSAYFPDDSGFGRITLSCSWTENNSLKTVHAASPVLALATPAQQSDPVKPE